MKQNNIITGGVETNMNTDHKHENAAEANRLWQESEQLPFIKSLGAGETAAQAIERLDTAKAFAECSDLEACCDGRLCSEDEHRLGVAGNGILLSKEELEEFVRFNRGKIKDVKSHDYCGAAAIKLKEMLSAGEPLPEGVTTADELGVYYSKELAKRLGATYSHIKMPDIVHNERAIYLDGTGKFNPAVLPELPAGFMCSGPALNLSSKYLEVELATLAKIALGDHGFGERFDQDNPLYLVVSAKDQAQLEELQRIARQAAEQFQGRVKVDGFIAK